VGEFDVRCRSARIQCSRAAWIDRHLKRSVGSEGEEAGIAEAHAFTLTSLIVLVGLLSVIAALAIVRKRR
jgi:hypothetical protein